MHLDKEGKVVSDAVCYVLHCNSAGNSHSHSRQMRPTVDLGD